MITRIGRKAKYERLYYNGIMYLAKGEMLLAEKFLNEAAIALKEYIMCLTEEERSDAKEWLIELCGHIKDIHKYYSTTKTKEDVVCSESEDNESFAFAKADVPNVSFSDVVGLEDVKEQVYDKIIYPRQYKELYTRFNKKMGGGILLYGPPGNGKTMIAKAIAHETDSAFYPVKFSDFGSKWFGETESKIRSLFEEARKEESAVIFFDEIDAIATNRSESSIMDRVIAELLTQIDGINKTGGNLTILAATNKLQNLDPAILRPGRFDEKIYVPLPDECARIAMFEKRLDGIPSRVTNFTKIALLSEGFSGAEIELVCENAKQRAIRRIISGTSKSTYISNQDIYEAISHVRAS